jgi:hypothetical protein
MRIIGGHDYYDGAMAYGQDRDLVFVRDNRIVENKDCPLEILYPHSLVRPNTKSRWEYRDGREMSAKTGQFRVSDAVVYVAGKRYGGVRIERVFAGLNNQFNEVFWDFDKFIDFIDPLGYKPYNPSKWDIEYRGGDKYTELKQWFEVRDVTKEEMDWIVANNAAIAIPYQAADRRDDKWGKAVYDWHINPATTEFGLKQMDFQKVMDPYTLFQELSMFVGGVLPRSGNPIVEITDNKIKIAKHGFNHPLSFRKQKAAK